MLLTGVGIVWLGVSLKQFRSRRDLARNGKVAHGVVCAIAERRQPYLYRLVIGYSPVVRFTTEQGAEIKYTAADWTYPSDFSEGDRVEIVYDPLDPQLAMISKPRINRKAMLIMGGVGAAFLLGGILLLIGVLPIQ
jgi:hypothetical protein